MEAAAIKTQDNAVMLVQQQETDLTNNQIVVLISVLHGYGYTRRFCTGLGTGTGTGSHIWTCQKPIPVVTGQGFTV
jgi:hypothetical protein